MTKGIAQRAFRASAGMMLALGLLAGSPVLAVEVTRERAVEISYRLERELGEVDAAQRHLLVWRLIEAHRSGEWRSGAVPGKDWLLWRQRLEQLEPIVKQGLPAWYDVTRPDAVRTIIDFHDGAPADLGWQHSGIAGPEVSAAVRGVLDDSRPRLSRSLVPSALAWSRSHGPEIWQELLELLVREPELLPLVKPLVDPWLALPVESPLQAWRALDDRSAAELAEWRDRSALADPLYPLTSAIDLLGSEQVVLLAHRSPDPAPARSARMLHHDDLDDLDRSLAALGVAAVRLEMGGHVEFIEVMVALTHTVISRSELIDVPSRLAPMLQQLGRLDPWLPDQLGSIDGRLLTVYQQLRVLLRDRLLPPDQRTLTRSQALHDLAALGSVTERLVDDLDGYLSQPVRQDFENRVLVCFGLATDLTIHPPVPISRQEFDDCMSLFARWATETAASVELSGDGNGPFERQHRSRELGLEPYQRINYWFGYQERLLDGACELEDATPWVNPLEWNLAARAYARFAHRWPAYFRESSAAETLAGIVARGEALLALWDRADQCRAQGHNALLAQLAAYQGNLDAFAQAVVEASERFRRAQLKPGADVRLEGDAWQATRYQPANAAVGPCEDEPSCGMADRLPASRALFELFPAPFLVADQIGLGKLDLCYQGVQWVDRRSELPAVRNQAMANYFGRLSFDLVGRYQDLDDPVFRLRLTSADEYEYLFGANRPEVLEDSCPRELIDTTVLSELPERSIPLIPRRLTFMTADRMQPTKVFAEHWSQGDEWQDWFLTGTGVERIEGQGPETLVPVVNQRLSELYREWNLGLYTQMFTSDPLGLDGEGEALRSALQALNESKMTSRSIARLVFPAAVTGNAPLRASLYGESGLFNQRLALQSQRDSVPVAMLAPMARGQFQDTLLLWRRSTTTGAMPRIRPDPAVVTTLLHLLGLETR